MTRVSRYIARLFLINIAALTLLLFSLVVMVDVVVNLGRFVRAASDALEASNADPDNPFLLFFTTVAAVADLWGPRLLQLFTYLAGAITIGALGFTCAQLVRGRELVALMAGGVSLHRVVAPFLAVGALVAALQIAHHEVFIPRVAHLLARDAGDTGQRSLDAFRVRLAPDGEGRVLYANRFDPATNTLTHPVIWERNQQGDVVRIIRADTAVWRNDAWQLTNGVAEDTLAAGLSPARQPIDRYPTALDPTRITLHHLQGFGQNLSWSQIGRLIESDALDERGARRLDQARWGRIASAINNLLALAAAAGVFLVRMPQPMLLPAVKSAPIVIAGLGASAASTSIAIPGFHPALSAFLPTLLLLPLAIALYTGIRS